MHQDHNIVRRCKNSKGHCDCCAWSSPVMIPCPWSIILISQVSKLGHTFVDQQIGEQLTEKICWLRLVPHSVNRFSLSTWFQSWPRKRTTLFTSLNMGRTRKHIMYISQGLQDSISCLWGPLDLVLVSPLQYCFRYIYVISKYVNLHQYVQRLF